MRAMMALRAVAGLWAAGGAAVLHGGVPDPGIWIPPGRFQMGSAAADPGRRADETRHEVRLTRGFWMWTNEVTQVEFESLMGFNPSASPGADVPVHGVTWDEARRWCLRKTMAGKQAGTIYPGESYRLPTEAEWEYAARAGGEATSAAALQGRAWSGKAGGPRPGGGGEANAWGLHDLSGNVAEWVEDHYVQYPFGPTTDPLAEREAGVRVIRGGAWMEPVTAARDTARNAMFGGVRWAGAGFRPVLAHGLSEAVTQGRDAALWRGMVACHALEGDASDASGLGRHGAVEGGVRWVPNRFGKAGRAAGFGPSGAVGGAEGRVAFPPLLDAGRRSWTFVAWVRKDAGSGLSGIAGFEDRSALWADDGAVGFQWGDGDDTASVAATVPSGRWFQLALTVSGERMAAFVDGALAGTGVRPGGFPALPTSGGWLGGGGPGGGLAAWKGAMDDVRWFARGLDDADVAALHALEAVPVNRPPVASGDAISRAYGNRVTKVRLSDLLANDTDPDGDALRVVAVGQATPTGAEVGVVGGFAVYVAGAGDAGHGSFEYQVSDHAGGHTAWGVVTVMETSGVGLSSGTVRANAVRIEADGGSVTFTGIGLPGRRYRLQYTTSVAEPYVWNELEPVGEAEAATTGAAGLFKVVDVAPGDTLRLYRAVVAP